MNENETLLQRRKSSTHLIAYCAPHVRAENTGRHAAQALAPTTLHVVAFTAAKAFACSALEVAA